MKRKRTLQAAVVLSGPSLKVQNERRVLTRAAAAQFSRQRGLADVPQPVIADPPLLVHQGKQQKSSSLLETGDTERPNETDLSSLNGTARKTEAAGAIDSKESRVMLYYGPLLKGKLLRRYKRFLADVELESGDVQTVYCPNTGPMIGLLDDMRPDVLLSFSENGKRKYAHTLEMIKVQDVESGPDGCWVGVHSAMANKMVRKALELGLIEELCPFASLSAEVKEGGSRFDFVLTSPSGQKTFVEVKSVTLADYQPGSPWLDRDIHVLQRDKYSRCALFPDTKSVRAAKHLEELKGLRRKGHKAAVLFLLQRGDCEAFMPSKRADAKFYESCHKANKEGVLLLAYRWKLKLQEGGEATVELDKKLPVIL